MKAFKKMAKTIRNVDEREGHSEATAAFIDAEFSDNSGKTLKSLRSPSACKRNRVNAICEKAATIMEDRLVRMVPRNHATMTQLFSAINNNDTNVPNPDCNQGASLQDGRSDL